MALEGIEDPKLTGGFVEIHSRDLSSRHAHQRSSPPTANVTNEFRAAWL